MPVLRTVGRLADPLAGFVIVFHGLEEAGETFRSDRARGPGET